MPPRKKSGRITLRMDPQIHARVEKAAKVLGMDINGLLNLLIRSHLPYYESVADLTSDPRTPGLFARWKKLNPHGDMDNFLADLAMQRPEDPPNAPVCAMLFEDNKFYILNAEGDDFVEVPHWDQGGQREQRSDDDAKK
jgi:hypothetical protein